MQLTDSLPTRQAVIFRAALIFSFALLWSVIIIAGIRSGLNNPWFAIISIVMFGLGAIWLPLAVISGSNRAISTAPGVRSLLLVAGPILPMLGLLIGQAATGCVAFGLLLLLVYKRTAFTKALAPNLASTLVGTAGAGLAIAAIIVTSGAPWRLFIPEAMTLGVAQADSYFHVAIAQVAAKFAIPSTGGDGLAWQHYHFGSHLTAAGLSAAANVNAGLVYVYWGAILLKIQVLWAFWLAATLLDKQCPQIFPSIAYSTMFLLLAPIESESFMLAIAVFASAAPLLCSLISSGNSNSHAFRAGLLIFVIVALVCAATKVSVGYYCGATFALIAWHRRNSLVDVALLILGMLVLALLTVSFVMPFEQSLADSGIGVLIGSYAQYANLITLVSYMLPGFVVWVFVAELRVDTSKLGDQPSRRSELRILYASVWRNGCWLQSLLRANGLVQLHALCLVACILALVSIPIGSGMAYFSYVLLLLPALIAPTWLRAFCVPGNSEHKALLAVAILCGVYLTIGFSVGTANTLAAIARSAQTLTKSAYRDLNDGPGLAKRSIVQSIRQSGTLLGSLHTQIDQTPWATLIQTLRNLSARDMQVFVPPTAEGFWNRLRAGGNNPYWCMQPHLMIPAETGIPMIFGIAPLKYEAGCSPIAGIYGFGKRQEQHRNRDLSDAQLCEIALPRNASAIYVLNSVESPDRNRVLHCR